MPPIHWDNFTQPGAVARFAVTACVGFGLDLWVKWLAVTHLSQPVSVIEFIPGWLHFTYTENHGAVFGLGQGMRWIFLIASIGAIAFLTLLFLQSGGRRFHQLVLGLLLAGVMGNMYDRVVFGYVRDMLHALPAWHWSDLIASLPPYPIFPWIFNLADSYLCVGIFLMLVHGLFEKSESPAAPSASLTASKSASSDS